MENQMIQSALLSNRMFVMIQYSQQSEKFSGITAQRKSPQRDARANALDYCLFC